MKLGQNRQPVLPFEQVTFTLTFHILDDQQYAYCEKHDEEDTGCNYRPVFIHLHISIIVIGQMHPPAVFIDGVDRHIVKYVSMRNNLFYLVIQDKYVVASVN